MSKNKITKETLEQIFIREKIEIPNQNVPFETFEESQKLFLKELNPTLTDREIKLYIDKLWKVFGETKNQVTEINDKMNKLIDELNVCNKPVLKILLDVIHEEDK